MQTLSFFVLACPLALATQGPPKPELPEPGFSNASVALGLGPTIVPETIARVLFTDLNGDGMPDLVVDRHRVFLNTMDELNREGAKRTPGRIFLEVPAEKTGLPEPAPSTLVVFADLDNDGHQDALITQYFESVAMQPGDAKGTAWYRGRGDGTFGPAQFLEGLPTSSTSAVAVGDVNLDGYLDVFLGNWYVRYGVSNLGYPNDLLWGDPSGKAPLFRRESLPGKSPRIFDVDEALPDFSTETDPDGRPTYGAMIADLDGMGGPEILELNYGRRWNRLWHQSKGNALWEDIGPASHFDGDLIRHGRYPQWAIEAFAKRVPPIEREPEAPFRSNGNTFDCSVGDVDNDGDFDILLTTIAHAWAGSSSDRSRILLQGEPLTFTQAPTLSLNRLGENPTGGNQGDLFGELADLDHDGRLDVLLSSGDYSDNQRLRIYLQESAGALTDRTAELGVDHDGSQQLSLADIDNDGDLDIAVGQTFNRFSAEQKSGRSPALKLLLNECSNAGSSLTIQLEGDGIHTNRDALGAVIRARLEGGQVLSRQLIGIGGHAGKQHAFTIHFGLGEAHLIQELTVIWPNRQHKQEVFRNVHPGAYTLREGGELKRRSQ